MYEHPWMHGTSDYKGMGDIVHLAWAVRNPIADSQHESIPLDRVAAMQ
jgi:hypothetical protein